MRAILALAFKVVMRAKTALTAMLRASSPAITWRDREID
jgi:hypothetical protein